MNDTKYAPSPCWYKLAETCSHNGAFDALVEDCGNQWDDYPQAIFETIMGWVACEFTSNKSELLNIAGKCFSKLMKGKMVSPKTLASMRALLDENVNTGEYPEEVGNTGGYIYDDIEEALKALALPTGEEMVNLPLRPLAQKIVA